MHAWRTQSHGKQLWQPMIAICPHLLAGVKVGAQADAQQRQVAPRGEEVTCRSRETGAGGLRWQEAAPVTHASSARPRTSFQVARLCDLANDRQTCSRAQQDLSRVHRHTRRARLRRCCCTVLLPQRTQFLQAELHERHLKVALRAAEAPHNNSAARGDLLVARVHQVGQRLKRVAGSQTCGSTDAKEGGRQSWCGHECRWPWRTQVP